METSPSLFVSGPEAEDVLGYLSKLPVHVRMAVKEEDFYYHRVSQDIVEDMIFAMEGWIPYVDLVQVFENELGLCITKDYMVAPVVFRTETSFDTMRREVSSRKRRSETRLRGLGRVGTCRTQSARRLKWKSRGRSNISWTRTTTCSTGTMRPTVRDTKRVWR